jgi:hypothetical protein
MDRNADLEAALSFVIGRIAEQAKLSGEPLTDEQRLLLTYLPSRSLPIGQLEIQEPVPRNINLERVCALAKAAYQDDRQSNPTSLDWEFALAVFTLYRHPMSGLLQWIGMKLRRPKWDVLALIVTAFLPIVALALAAWNADGPMHRSVGIGAACIAMMPLIFFALKRSQKQRLEEDIRRYRPGSRFVSTVTR